MKDKSKPKESKQAKFNIVEAEEESEVIEEIPPVAPVEIPEPVSEVPTVASDAATTRTSERFEDFGSTSLHHGRVTKNLWQVCCNEVNSEMAELNSILTKLGLPPENYSKDKTYTLTDYEEAPDLESSKSKDFLDFWVFPILLPAIQSLLHFAKMNRVFQCRYCSFNSLDYIVEYLYNNNPRYPDRLENPTPLFEIEFVKKWLAKYPRPPLPKWLTMTDGEAVTIIQRAVRGFLVRVRPDVQEMRQFWKDFKKDAEAEKSNQDDEERKPSNELFSPYYSELAGEFDAPNRPKTPDYSHSDTCMVCARFKEYLEQRRLHKQPTAGSYPGESGSDIYYEEYMDDRSNQLVMRQQASSTETLGVNQTSKSKQYSSVVLLSNK